jgi:predicted dehydrogenase
MIEGARLAAVASGRIENARRMADEFSMRAVASWDELVTLSEVDLVVISSPPNTHHPVTLAALDAGKHVICEKPMAMTAGEALEMTNAAQARSAQLAIIDHELRFNPTYRRMKELVDEGYLGRLYNVSMTIATGFRHSALRPWNWWSQKSAGGGLLGALGSHAIDTLRWLFGDIDAVAASVATIVPMRVDPETNQPREVETDDYCSFLFRFSDSHASRALGTVTLTAVQASGGTNELTLAGEHGTIILDNEKLLAAKGFNAPFEDLTPADPARKIEGIPDNQWARSFYHLADKTIGALLKEEFKVEGAATFDDGLKCQRVIDAIIRANTRQEWEKVD